MLFLALSPHRNACRARYPRSPLDSYQDNFMINKMNTEQLNNWKLNILNSIKEISDLENQKLTWTGKHLNEVSSYVEVINTLYDDYFFDEFIAYVKENEPEKKELYSMILELDDKINNYQEKEKSNLEIINDPKWIHITKVAESITKIWV